MDQIGVQWPDSDVDDDGNLVKYDLAYLSQAMFFVKALPVSPAYMEEMLPDIDLDQICTEIFATDLLELIFNKYNVQTLFTMCQFTSELYQQEYYNGRIPKCVLAPDHELFTGRVIKKV